LKRVEVGILELTHEKNRALMQCLILVWICSWWSNINSYLERDQPHHTFQSLSWYRPILPMTSPSPTSPLALTNSSDGSSDHHDNIFTYTNTSQPKELPMLDRVRPHNNSQSDPTRHTPYADASNSVWGGNGNPQVPTI